ncbi:MAG: hypothetical protein EBQ56_12900 [Proteobacteria bacterium]|nr:hypothetical protein [Pseudomonadota bacterium]
MPADHDAGRTGDLPVSAEVRRLSRSGRSPPHCRWGSADPDLGAPALSPAQDDPMARNLLSSLSVEAQAWKVAPGCPWGNPAGGGAGAPGDARTGDLSVSGPIRQTNRTDWNTPTTARPPREALQ